MKTTLIAFALLVSQTIFAGVSPVLQAGDLSVYNARVSLLSVNPYCPSTPNGVSCQAMGATVTVLVRLKGCADRVIATYSKYNDNHGTGQLAVAVLAVATKMSTQARCFAAPTATVTISIPSGSKVELQGLNFNGEGDLQF